MWCWHRIRETESGLCPACRTPYGEDPHQFSAVDVEEVLKANKEKEAAAKRQRQQMGGGGLSGSAGGSHTNSINGNTNEDGMDPMDIPKDRTQLANMRVIRRNLVYAVGLPPSIAVSEEHLRKPEFFGQYGKISKIVINRSQANVADARRASASAYVTFAHKEDTLACILALDGFYLDNRNIRASYGTSKYCSAFIKNVRCNNPDCTYLHEMGAAEDTFTKQEIQAGYVTSGRDVLARQQQIVAEQLRQTGSSGGPPRKRIGGGGPSGTDRASSNPVFPPPEFDEPTKPAPTLVPPPPSAIASRTVSVPTGTAVMPPPRQHARSSSFGTTASVGSKSPTLSSIVAAPKTPAVPVVSAASVVAGVRPVAKPAEPPAHTTLTPLTPLKRNKSTSKSVGELDKLRGATTGTNSSAAAASNNSIGAGTKKKNGIMPQTMPPPVIPPPTTSNEPVSVTGPGSIGGDIIGPPNMRKTSSIGSLGGEPVGPGALGGRPLEAPMPGSLLGGEVFHGPLEKKPITTAIGSGKDKWTSSGPSSDMWNSSAPAGPIGGQQLGGGPNSSSALASLLGINLPTGSGSLRETNLWEENPAPIAAPSPLASLNGTSMPVNAGEPLMHGSSLIGGVPIGGAPSANNNSRMNAAPGAIGGAALGGGGKSDIALLQSLLPGVHITSGNDAYGGFGWNSGPGGLNGDAISHWNAGGGAGGTATATASVGTIGRNSQQQNGQGIW